jgi:hypothetical protein
LLHSWPTATPTAALAPTPLAPLSPLARSLARYSALDARSARSLTPGVLHALSVVEWAPALPVPVDIRLTHPDPGVLLYDYILSKGVPAGFSSLALSVMEP